MKATELENFLRLFFSYHVSFYLFLCLWVEDIQVNCNVASVITTTKLK